MSRRLRQRQHAIAAKRAASYVGPPDDDDQDDEGEEFDPDYPPHPDGEWRDNPQEACNAL